MNIGSPDIINTTWWKTDGSDHFKVRDVIWDGTKMMISTYDGRTLDGDAMSRYVQSETPIGKKPKVPPAPKISKAQLLQGLDPEELGDVMVHEPQPKGPVRPSQKSQPQPTQVSSQKSEDEIILDRMFKHLNIDGSAINISVEISDEFKNNIKNVFNGFGIPLNNIADYIVKNKSLSLEKILADKLIEAICQNSNQ